MTVNWFTREQLDLPCTVDLEQTIESLHAYVEIDGVAIRPGDQVIVHDPPTQVEFGERLVCGRRVTIVRANFLGSVMARLQGYLELTELYEVSFSGGRVS